MAKNGEGGSIWLERPQYTEWMALSRYRKQWPVPYQVFAWVAHCSPRRLRARVDVERLFWLALGAHRLLGGATYHPMSLGAYRLWLDLTDPRCVRAPLDFLREPSVPSLLREVLRGSSGFVDVGSNHGTFAVAAAHILSEDSLIIAIEPQPRLALAVRRALAETSNVRHRIFEGALSEEKGHAKCFIPSANPGEAGLHEAFSGRSAHKTIKVETSTLDSILSEQPTPEKYVVKIDVEGGEYRVLRGGRERLRQDRPKLIMEVNRTALQNADVSEEALVRLLLDCGYRWVSDFRRPQDKAPLLEGLGTARNVVITE